MQTTTRTRPPRISYAEQYRRAQLEYHKARLAGDRVAMKHWQDMATSAYVLMVETEAGE